MNLDFDMGESFLADHQDQEISPSQQLGVEVKSVDSHLQITGLAHQASGNISTPDQNLDVKAELDSLLTSLQLATNPAVPQVEAIDSSILEIKQLKFRTQQLAKYSQTRFDQVEQRLASIEQIPAKIASMSIDLSTKLTELDYLSTQLAATHTEIVTTDQTTKERIVEIDRRFVELVASVQTEKQQFYELTVETIEKADAIKSQLANISNQIRADRESISALKNELESVRHLVRQETEHKLNNLDLRYHQLLSMWDDFQIHYKDRAVNVHKLQRWLWILSTAVVCIFVMLIRVLIILK